jgi:hypothetical protein
MTMAKYVSAKEFRQRLPNIGEDLKQWGEIVVLKRSKPLFKAIPFEESKADLLDRAASQKDGDQPDLYEISRIVHDLRKDR